MMCGERSQWTTQCFPYIDVLCDGQHTLSAPICSASLSALVSSHMIREHRTASSFGGSSSHRCVYKRSSKQCLFTFYKHCGNITDRQEFGSWKLSWVEMSSGDESEWEQADHRSNALSDSSFSHSVLWMLHLVFLSYMTFYFPTWLHAAGSYCIWGYKQRETIRPITATLTEEETSWVT